MPTDMRVNLTKLWILTAIILKHTVSGRDTEDVPDVCAHYNVTVLDSEPPRRLVFNISHVTKCSRPPMEPDITMSSVVYNYCIVKENNTALFIKNPIDLEVLYVQKMTDVLTLFFNCSEGMLVMLDVKVDPVNEFPTVFKQSSYEVMMEEMMGSSSKDESFFDGYIDGDPSVNTEPGETVFSFTKDMFTDEDVLEEITLRFGIENHSISELNGLGRFNITPINGTVYPTQRFDAETLTPGLFYLNITITDPMDRTKWSKLTVNVIDVDDNHPIFTTDPSCNRALCRVLNYTGILSLDDGLVYNMRPASILAVDGDKTLNAQVTYNITEAHPELYENVVTINGSGIIEFCTDCKNFTTNVSCILLIIQATELTENQFSTNATVLLEVQMKENISPACCGTSPSPTDVYPNYCNCTSASMNASDDEPFAYVLKIVLPTCAAILITVLVTVVVIMMLKRNTRGSTYNFKGKRSPKPDVEEVKDLS